MKKLITLITLLSAMMTASVQANTIDQVEQTEMAKKQLAASYNAFVSMSDRQYKKAMRELAEQAAKAELTQEAELFYSLSNDPKSRLEILEQMKGQIEASSENGIYFIIYLMYPQTWCFAGDIRCGFGVGLLSLLTLSGDEASDI